MEIIYDCEIIKMIPQKSEVRLDGFEYCEGWRDFENMGLSVIGVVEVLTEDQWFFTDIEHEGKLGGIQDFNNFLSVHKPKIWGFNSSSFDDELCKSNNVNVTTDHDLLNLIRIAAYGSPSWEDQPKGYSYKLDSIARANGAAKTGSGSLAPKLWQEKKYQEVIDYCLNDCLITAKMIKLFCECKLKDPNTGKIL